MADDHDARSAIEEGRRIYVGSLRYTAKPEDIEVLLQSHGFTHEKIHMSIDPISDRNPGYCFVELPSAEEATRALSVLDGQSVLGRSVKTGPCEAKGSTPRYKSYERNKHQDREPTFQRWGDWRGGSAAQAPTGSPSAGRREHRTEQPIDVHAASNDGRRLFVSGLPKMLNQQENDAEMRDFFSGFEVTAVGKRVIPFRLRNTSDQGDNCHHCFVDMASPEQAQAAVKALDGNSFNGGAGVRVNIARPQSGGAQRPGEDKEDQTRKPKAEPKERPGMAGASWRRPN
ncbi:hypothetical protein NLU13_7601 [Sarocladium strictum]|uniref:RRM domain-containing protein n=1 Tax=Sarocladium strictum TaxID=5046 RepID=A0AA39GEA3_SARSR|nr:hypothetical protein NLU13_7601 [Sarocladium strictum]